MNNKQLDLLHKFMQILVALLIMNMEPGIILVQKCNEISQVIRLIVSFLTPCTFAARVPSPLQLLQAEGPCLPQRLLKAQSTVSH